MPQFRAHVQLADGTLGHIIPNGEGDSPSIMAAIRGCRTRGETREIVIRDKNGNVVGHSYP